MNLLRLAFKNATVKWWRSLTLGLFIFAISFVIIIANSFISAIQSKVENVIVQGISGHIQIRSDRSFEGDMVEQYNKDWNALKPLSPATIQRSREIIAQKYPNAQTALLVRQSAYLSGQNKREETMLLGIESSMSSYKDAFILKEGRYLNPEGTREILLTEEQANSFKVKPGDSISIVTKNRFGLNSRVDLQVVGIGNFVMLSLFSFKACYLHDSTVRELAQLDQGEATDLIVFLKDKGRTDLVIGSLVDPFKAAGIKTTITKGEKLKSEDIQVTKIDFDEEETTPTIKLSSYQEMGQTFKSASDIMFIMLNIVVIFLLTIVSILIMNLVYMMGLERYREIGTLRALGFSQYQVIKIFMGEILSVTIIFGLLGILLGSSLILSFGRSGIPSPIPAMDFIMGKTLYLQIDPGNILLTIVIFVVFSLIASFYPAYKACSIKPAETLRSA